MNHWMFRCNEVTRRVSQSLDEEPPFFQRVLIRMHLLMCKFCSRQKKQMLFIRDLLRIHSIPRKDPAPPAILSQEARERIKHSLVS
ncbi:MAG: anti-sigma factor [Deltaproteobacteria bacterium]|nr:anti-sigma factor [Deltaproteobacteria bacterium]